MERLAMPAPRFWRLIASLHGSNADAAYHRLSEELAKEPVRDVLGFDARLVLVLRALDDECRADWYSAHDPTGLGFLADDDFLYVRADTVTEGEATWRIALATDTLPWGTIDPAETDGEGLLYVGMDAAKRHGIDEDSWIAREGDAFPLDYESGSNTAGWPPPKR